MKFSSILFAAFGVFSVVSALPAPVAEADMGVSLPEKRALVEREPVSDLEERSKHGKQVKLVEDVTVIIEAIVVINEKWSKKRRHNNGKSCAKSWAAEVVAQIKILITIISGYPENCKYPSTKACVEIFVKLFITIFIQLKSFCEGSGGLLGGLVVNVNIIVSILISVVGDLCQHIITLCVLIEIKIKVGLCQKIVSGCGGLLSTVYIKVFIQLLIKAGINIY
ncbi:hypothetical protein ABW19_dt0206385 [Dactylella cylindrospora]|nr:hypothetical protein ABW19_dt0206385 [Dactylella cylindrospora]